MAIVTQLTVLICRAEIRGGEEWAKGLPIFLLLLKTLNLTFYTPCLYISIFKKTEVKKNGELERK